VYFNVLAARVYIKQPMILDGKGVLFEVADDVKIMGPPEVIKEMAEGFPTLAWEEASLTTQMIKSRIYVQFSAQASWSRFLDLTPRNNQTELPVHDIPDGNELVDPFDSDSERIWREENGVKIMGTTLGSNSFVASYLQGKGLKHHLFLRFIKDVAAIGFPREAGNMMRGAALPRLSHILRSVQKNKHTVGWMTKMNGTHLLAWLHCLTASEELKHAMGPEGRKQLSDLLDMLASYGGARLQSLEASADVEFRGSFAGIASAMISFYRKTEPLSYTRIAEVLER